MALPGSGALTTEQIRLEFGGSLPFITANYYRGGGLVPDTPANANIPTSGAMIIPNDFWGASASAGVSIANHTITGHNYQETNDDPPPAFTNTGPAQATYTLLNSGVAQANFTDGGIDGTTDTTPFAGEWRVSGASAAYDVMFTPLSGTMSYSGSATGVWLNLGTTRSITATAPFLSVPLTNTLSVRIRPAGGGADLDSCTITFQGIA